eukprot:scaffold244369_cov15-Tisochrysis_lutea.AAC.1
MGMGTSTISAPLPFLLETTPEQPDTLAGRQSSPLLIPATPSLLKDVHRLIITGSGDMHSLHTTTQDTHEAARSASLRSQRARQLLRVDDSASSLSPSASSESQGPSKCTSLGSHQNLMVFNRSSMSPPATHHLHRISSASFGATHPPTAFGYPPASADGPPLAPSSTSTAAAATASHPLTIAIPRTPHELQRAHLQQQEGVTCGSAPAGSFMEAHAPVRLGSTPEAHRAIWTPAAPAAPRGTPGGVPAGDLTLGLPSPPAPLPPPAAGCAGSKYEHAGACGTPFSTHPDALPQGKFHAHSRAGPPPAPALPTPPPGLPPINQPAVLFLSQIGPLAALGGQEEQLGASAGAAVDAAGGAVAKDEEKEEAA